MLMFVSWDQCVVSHYILLRVECILLPGALKCAFLIYINPSEFIIF